MKFPHNIAVQIDESELSEAHREYRQASLAISSDQFDTRVCCINCAYLSVAEIQRGRTSWLSYKCQNHQRAYLSDPGLSQDFVNLRQHCNGYEILPEKAS